MDISLMTKTNDEAFEIFNRFLRDDIDQEFIDELFREDNFHNFTALGRVTAIYNAISLSFLPLHYSGAFKLINPSLPELHFGGYQNQEFRLSYNFIHRKFTPAYGFMAAPYIATHKRRVVTLDTDILTTSVLGIKDTTKKHKSTGQTGGISLSLLAKNQKIPTLQIKLDSLGSKRACQEDKCPEPLIDAEQNLLESSSAGLAYMIRHPLGMSSFSINIPFQGIFQDQRQDEVSMTAVYHLSHLASVLSFSPLKSSFGFMFYGELYSVGIQHTNEKQDNEIQIKRQKHSYVFIKFQP